MVRESEYMMHLCVCVVCVCVCVLNNTLCKLIW